MEEVIIKKKSFISKIWGLLWPFILASIVQSIALIIYDKLAKVEYPPFDESLGVKAYFKTFLEFESQHPMKEVIMYAVIILFFLLLYHFWDRRKIQVEKSTNILKPIDIIYLIFFALGLGFSFSVVVDKLPDLFGLDQLLSETAFKTTDANILYQLLIIGILGPIAEEMEYRLILYRRSKSFFGFIPAIILSAFIFGIIHINFIQVVNAIFLGIFLALVYEHYGVLWASIIIHVTNNLASVLLGYINAETAFENSIVVYVVGFVLFIVFGYLIFFKRGRVNNV